MLFTFHDFLFSFGESWEIFGALGSCLSIDDDEFLNKKCAKKIKISWQEKLLKFQDVK